MDNQPPQPPSGSEPASTDTRNETPVNDTELHKEKAPDWPNAIPNGTIFSYNLDDSTTPGGLKVRWKIRVATGPEAALWDARQAEAIREFVTWAHSYRQRQGSWPPGNPSG